MFPLESRFTSTFILLRYNLLMLLKCGSLTCNMFRVALNRNFYQHVSSIGRMTKSSTILSLSKPI